MYRVVVVDDEDIIVRGIVQTMPWAKYNCEVVATASDGLSAIDLLHREKADILFSDIQMPGKDGLAMIAAVRSEFPDMQITILSGYPNFEYAQRAISLGVVRYVLKPSKFAELEEALKQMTDNLAVIVARNKRRAQLDVMEEPAQPLLLDTEQPTQEAELSSEAVVTAEEKPNAENAQNFIVHNAQEYIRTHYAEKLTLNDVAEKVYVSQWHLSKLIARYTKQSFFDLLNGARIERAKELLADPSLRIWEISEQVGFAEVTHFSRIFKKIVGMSANEYRATHLCKKED